MITRVKDSESVNPKDSLDKEDKDVFITLNLHTFGVTTEGEKKLEALRHDVNNTKGHNVATHDDRRDNATWDVGWLKKDPTQDKFSVPPNEMS